MVEFLHELETRIASRKATGDPAVSYTARQLQAPAAELYRKLPEEATEVVLSCLAPNPDRERRTGIVQESADMLFQLMIVLAHNDIRLDEVMVELKRRATDPHQN